MLISPASASSSLWRAQRLVRPAIPRPRRRRNPTRTASDDEPHRSLPAPDLPCRGALPGEPEEPGDAPAALSPSLTTERDRSPPAAKPPVEVPPRCPRPSASLPDPATPSDRGDRSAAGIHGSSPRLGRPSPSAEARAVRGPISGNRDTRDHVLTTPPPATITPYAAPDDNERTTSGPPRKKIRTDQGSDPGAATVAAAARGDNPKLSRKPRLFQAGETKRRLPINQLATVPDSVFVELEQNLAADDSEDGVESLSQATDPIEESQHVSAQPRATSTKDRGTADASKPTERLSMLKHRIRIPKLSPGRPDLSMFQIPKSGTRGKNTCARKFTSISDGFAGSELSVPPKQKRMRRLRGRSAVSGCLEIVDGLPVPDLPKEVRHEIPGGLSVDSTSHVAQKSPQGLFIEDGAVVPSMSGPERRIHTASRRRLPNPFLSQEHSQQNWNETERYREEHEERPFFTGQVFRRQGLDPVTAFQLSKITAPALVLTDDEQDEDEDEGNEGSCESSSQESDHGTEEDDGASSEAESSSDSTADDGSHMADAGSPLLERTDDNDGEGNPDASNASETFSDRIHSTSGLSGNETALVQRRVPLSFAGNQFRIDLDEHVDMLTRPGQAARMKSSGVWMEVQEDIVSTPAGKRRVPDVPQKKKSDGMRSAISHEALGPGLPGTGKRLDTAAAASVSSSQRTGHDQSGNSGTFSRRYSAYVKDQQTKSSNDAAPSLPDGNTLRHSSHAYSNSSRLSSNTARALTDRRKHRVRRTSQVLVSDSTRDYFIASQRQLFTDNDGHVQETPLFTDHIGPDDNDEDADRMAQVSARRWFPNDLRPALPNLRTNQYSQHQAAHLAAAANVHTQSAEASHIVGMTHDKHGRELPSLLLDPPFLK